MARRAPRPETESDTDSTSRPRRAGGLGAAGLDLDGLDDIVGLHLRLAQAAAHRDFLDRLASLELTQKQTAVLWLVGANPGVSQIALATTLGMDRATMMAIVDRLDVRGLVVRRRSTEDRRRQALSLTEAGRAVLDDAKVAIAGHEAALKSKLGARDCAAFIAALKRLQK